MPVAFTGQTDNINKESRQVWAAWDDLSLRKLRLLPQKVEIRHFT